MVYPQIGKIQSQKRGAAVAVPVGQEVRCTVAIERLLDRQEGGGMTAEEGRIIDRVGQVVAAERRIDAIVGGPGALAQMCVRVQPLAPNTRSKIASMRLRW